MSAANPCEKPSTTLFMHYVLALRLDQTNGTSSDQPAPDEPDTRVEQSQAQESVMTLSESGVDERHELGVEEDVGSKSEVIHFTRSRNPDTTHHVSPPSCPQTSDFNENLAETNSKRRPRITSRLLRSSTVT